jgi:SAM-dependent methyltransferase
LSAGKGIKPKWVKERLQNKVVWLGPPCGPGIWPARRTLQRLRMTGAQLGRSTVRFVPLRAELGRSADWNFAGKSPVRDVPYVPTPENVVAKMLEVADVGPKDLVYDLGCGDGRIIVTAAKERGARGVGIDIDPERIKQSQLNAINSGVSDRVRFELTSVFRAEISDATVVSLYLLPWMNAQLRPKLLAELKPGTRIVAHQFSIAAWPADRIVRIPNQDRVVYFWVVPANVKGEWQCTLRTADGILRRGTMRIEQEFSTILCELTLDGNDLTVESANVIGDRMELRIGGVTYFARIERDSLRGAGRRNKHGGRLEIRARRG